MNREHLRQLADHLEENVHLYDQSDWGDAVLSELADGAEPSCGTSACIAGHAAMLAGYHVVDGGNCYLPGQHDTVQGFVAGIAGRWLGLTTYEHSLFEGHPYGAWPDGFGYDWDNLDNRERAREAIRLLRALADGEATLRSGF